MRVVFNPTEKETGCGVKSLLRWDSAEFVAALQGMFNIRPKETIVRLDIVAEGVSAYFETKD